MEKHGELCLTRVRLRVDGAQIPHYMEGDCCLSVTGQSWSPLSLALSFESSTARGLSSFGVVAAGGFEIHGLKWGPRRPRADIVTRESRAVHRCDLGAEEPGQTAMRDTKHHSCIFRN